MRKSLPVSIHSIATTPTTSSSPPPRTRSSTLWVTAFYARASERWRGVLVFYAKTLAAGLALFTLPAIVFAPDLLGGPELPGRGWG